MVARFGMCEEFDMMALGTVHNQYLDGSYSMSCAQETYAAADRATIAVIRQCHEEAKAILVENRELLDKIAAYLLQKETITGQEMMAIIEGRDPELVDDPYASTQARPKDIEAPARKVHMISEKIESPAEAEAPATPESPAEPETSSNPEETAE